MYAGEPAQYRADLLTLTPDGRVVGDDLWKPTVKIPGLFSANQIA